MESDNLDLTMGSKIPPSKRSPLAHKAANARWFAKNKERILAEQRAARTAKRERDLKVEAEFQEEVNRLAFEGLHDLDLE